MAHRAGRAKAAGMIVFGTEELCEDSRTWHLDWCSRHVEASVAPPSMATRR